ncbi:MAG: hypothetical protein M3Z31_01000 [Pseudomonadota bacterium]|nr:hypothetical protein [Pseudomonadota bacterium]
MPNRTPPKNPQNMTRAREKNVRDPGAHPMDTGDSTAATEKRRTVSGDDHMRLPYEHDETGDVQERAGGTDKLMEQAADDARSPQQDTDRRSDAVENFDKGRPPPARGGKVR